MPFKEKSQDDKILEITLARFTDEQRSETLTVLESEYAYVFRDQLDQFPFKLLLDMLAEQVAALASNAYAYGSTNGLTSAAKGPRDRINALKWTSFDKFLPLIRLSLEVPIGGTIPQERAIIAALDEATGFEADLRNWLLPSLMASALERYEFSTERQILNKYGWIGAGQERARHTYADDIASMVLEAPELHAADIDAGLYFPAVTLATAAVSNFSNVENSAEFISVANTKLYYLLRRALYRRSALHSEDGDNVPSTELAWDGEFIDELKYSSQNELSQWPKISPAERKVKLHDWWKQIETLNDLDADVLDLLVDRWIKDPNPPSYVVLSSVDDLLAYRGLAKKKGGADARRGGYDAKSRDATTSAITHLNNLWLSKSLGDGRPERAIDLRWVDFEVPKPGRSKAFKYRLGSSLRKGLSYKGRQTALLSIKVVQYSLKDRKTEKKLARYLSWLWRIRASRQQYFKPLAVKRLLSESGLENDTSSKYYDLRAKLEKALSRLADDRIITSWEYQNISKDSKMSFSSWNKLNLVISPPPSIIKHYAEISKSKSTKDRNTKTKKPAATKSEPSLGNSEQ